MRSASKSKSRSPERKYDQVQGRFAPGGYGKRRQQTMNTLFQRAEEEFHQPAQPSDSPLKLPSESDQQSICSPFQVKAPSSSPEAIQIAPQVKPRKQV